MALLPKARGRSGWASGDRNEFSSHTGRARFRRGRAALCAHHPGFDRGDRGRRGGLQRRRRCGVGCGAQRQNRRAKGRSRSLGALRLRRAEPVRGLIGGGCRRGDGVPLRQNPDSLDARAVSASAFRRGFGARRRDRRGARRRDPQGARTGIGAALHVHRTHRSGAREQRAGLPDRVCIPARGVGLDADEPASRRREDLLRRSRPSRPGAAPNWIASGRRRRAASPHFGGDCASAR